MKNNNKKEAPVDSRRKFINKGFFASAGWLAGMANVGKEEVKKVKMLTPDGELVEIDESLILNNSSKKKVRNQDILEWTNTQKSNKDIQ